MPLPEDQRARTLQRYLYLAYVTAGVGLIAQCLARLVHAGMVHERGRTGRNISFDIRNGALARARFGSTTSRVVHASARDR